MKEQQTPDKEVPEHAGGQLKARARRPRWLWLIAALVAATVTCLCFGITLVGLNAPKEQAKPMQANIAMAPTPTPVAPDRRQVFTYYFYWYDIYSGGHFDKQSGIKNFPPDEPAASWRNVDWHKKELVDMLDAGIDSALLVYWGFDNPADAWSYEGLDVIAEAWDDLNTGGTQPPGLGMFFDTTIIRGRDLTTSEGKHYFYANLQDFFTRIPRNQWALVNNRPVVFLFTSDWTDRVDQSTFDYAYEQFEAEFGVRPYIVREASWNYPIEGWEGDERIRDFSTAIETDNSYPWAGSILGYTDNGGVASIGPGYDDRDIPDRGRGTVVDREDGEFYHRNFEAAIESGKPLLVIETWNEFHEASGIAETKEYGREYIELTRELVDRFHAAGE